MNEYEKEIFVSASGGVFGADIGACNGFGGGCRREFYSRGSSGYRFSKC